MNSLTFSDWIFFLSTSCYRHNRQRRFIRPYFDTLANTIVYSKLDYFNSLYYRLPKSHITRLQRVSERFGTHCCYSSWTLPYHYQPTLSPLAQNNWMHRIQTPVTNLQSSYNHPTSISSSLFTCSQPSLFVCCHLAQPSTTSSLRITDRFFQYASPCLWNQLPVSLRQPHLNVSISDLILPALVRLSHHLPLLLFHHSPHP